MRSLPRTRTWRGAIEAWVAKGKHGKLLELWVKGLSFDWQRLYGEAKPRRISLPTYPFARERYWIEPVRGRAAVRRQAGPASARCIRCCIGTPRIFRRSGSARI